MHLRIFTNDSIQLETKLRFCPTILDAFRGRFEPDTSEAWSGPY